VDEQVKVSMKALAYVELFITFTCVHLLKSSKFVGNPVKAYLDTLSVSQLVDLKKDVEAALGHCEDSNRYMAVYRGESDFAKRIRKQCFDKDGTPLKPHKLSDSLQKLHARLGCHSLHSIPIGFYHAKWSEKLLFHLANAFKPERSHSRTSSSRTRTPSPKMAPASMRSSGDPSRSPNPPKRHIKSPTIASSSAAPNTYTAMRREHYMEQDAKFLDTKQSIEEAEERLNGIREKRAAIFDDTKDGLLKKEEDSVFWYRHARRATWRAADTMLNEQEWNDQHDREQLEKLQKEEEQLETLLARLAKSIGYGPIGQGSN
jgi:hypothetical protein